MQAVFSMSQLQYFQLSTIVELYKKNQETQKFCPLALIFHLAPYLIFIAVLKILSRIRTTRLRVRSLTLIILTSVV